MKSPFFRHPASLPIILAVLFLLCLSFVVGVVINGFPPPTPTPTAIAPGKVFDSSKLPAKELWQKSGMVYVINAPALALTDDTVVAGYHFDRKIAAFDSQTGNVIWEVAFEGSLGTIVVDADAVYAATDRVEAYVLETGQSLWRSETAKVRRHGGHWLDVTPEGLNYYFHQNVTSDKVYSAFLRLDKRTGQVKDEVAEDQEIFFWQNQIKYRLADDQLLAINTTNDQLLWSITLDDYPQRLPTVLDQVMYIATKEPELRTRERSIYAVNLLTGEVTWKVQEEIISNIAVTREAVFAISGEGNILAWDSLTGEPVGQIVVTPKVERDRMYQNRYSIGASDQLLVVYYGDSQQLVAFEMIR